MLEWLPFNEGERNRIEIVEGEVHLWRFSLDLRKQAITDLNAVLSPPETARAQRLRFERDRDRFVVGRGTLRKLLALYLGIRSDLIVFETNRHGKPSLSKESSPQPLRFNLSHTGGQAVVGFALEHEIGVDIELIRQMHEISNIVERFFSPTEKAAFALLSEDQKETAFFRTWTRKEAYLKGIGLGLFKALDVFDVPVSPGRNEMLHRLYVDLEPETSWTMRDFDAGLGIVGAVAVNTQTWLCTKHEYVHIENA